MTGAVEVRSSDVYEVEDEAHEAEDNDLMALFDSMHETHIEAGYPEYGSCPVCGDEDGRSL